LRRKLGAVLLSSLLALSLGCGTLLYPERRGQPRGELDVVVVLLDSIGLVYFVVPGLVAFAVDFATGAIYLPKQDAPPESEPLARIRVRELARHGRDPRAIEAALREEAGIELAPRWGDVLVLRDCAEQLPVATRVLELHAAARQGLAGAPPRLSACPR